MYLPINFRQGAEIGKGIMFSDSDSLSQNSRIGYDILNDPRHLVVPRCQAFDVHHMELHTSAINCSKCLNDTIYFDRLTFVLNLLGCHLIKMFENKSYLTLRLFHESF